MTYLRAIIAFSILSMSLFGQGVPSWGPPTSVIPGSYDGPGDTVPPYCTATCPDQADCTLGPCAPGLFPLECTPCHGSASTLNNALFTNGTVWAPAPACFAGTPTYVTEITFEDLRVACELLGPNAVPNVINVCVPNPCPFGFIEDAFVYATTPLQYQTGAIIGLDGNAVDICGVSYDVKINRNINGNQTCTSLGPTQNANNYPLNCDSTIQDLVIQVDCSCIENIVDKLTNAGLFGRDKVYGPETVAFVVLIKCCN